MFSYPDIESYRKAVKATLEDPELIAFYQIIPADVMTRMLACETVKAGFKYEVGVYDCACQLLDNEFGEVES